MNSLKIKKTSDSPFVLLDAEDERFEIRGRLIPEDPNRFFKPVIDWSSEYIKDPNPSTEINLHIEYINTSSSKSLMQILKIYETLNKIDNSVKINWFFTDEDMMEAAQDYQSILKIPISIEEMGQI